MIEYAYINGQLEPLSSDVERCHYDWTGDDPPIIIPYTAEENAEADAREMERIQGDKRQELLDSLGLHITKALERQAAYQAVIDTPNSEINSHPAPYIVSVARQGKRSERAIIALCRLVGDLLDSTDTGTD